MTQPIRAYTCPHCGPSIVSLLPGESWWDICPNLSPMSHVMSLKWGNRLWVCGILVKHRKVGQLVQGVTDLLGYTTQETP